MSKTNATTTAAPQDVGQTAEPRVLHRDRECEGPTGSPRRCPTTWSDVTINLSDNSLKVLEKRYLRRDYDGSYLETPAGMFYRVAYHVAQVEEQHGGDARPRRGSSTTC